MDQGLVLYYGSPSSILLWLQQILKQFVYLYFQMSTWLKLRLWSSFFLFCLRKEDLDFGANNQKFLFKQNIFPFLEKSLSQTLISAEQNSRFIYIYKTFQYPYISPNRMHFKAPSYKLLVPYLKISLILHISRICRIYVVFNLKTLEQ